MAYIKNVRKYNMSTREATNLLSIIPDPEDIIFKKKSNKNLATIIDEIDGSLVGKTDIGHKHNVSDISDFPTNISSFKNDAGYLVMDDITSMNHNHDNKDVLDYLNWEYLADLEDKYTRQELEEKFENETGIMMTRFAGKNHQHRIEDITNYTPPATHLSQFENDTNFITNTQAQSLIDSAIESGSIGGSGHTHNNLNILDTINNQLIRELKDKYTKSETDTKINTVKNNVYTKNESDILLSGKSDEDHTHNAWDLNWEGYNIADHTHKMSDITNLETTLNNKAELFHNHSIADITNLQDILNLKAPLNHIHDINTIDGYQYFDNYDFLKTLTEDTLNDINWNIESLEYKIECGNMDRVYWCGTSTGTNDYVVSNVYEVPDGISLKEGLTIRFKVGVTNTSTSCTIKLNDHDKVTIKNIDGENPSIGALKEGTIYQFTYTVNNNIALFILLDTYTRESTTGITKVSELDNDSNFISQSDMSDYTYDKNTIDDKIANSTNSSESIEELKIVNDTGTAAGIIVISTIDLMYDNYRKIFIAANDNNGSFTTVNGLPLYKEGTTEPPIIKAGRTYTVRYSESDNCFFVLTASSEGTATPAQVLAGYTFSNENNIGLEGTINNLSGSNMGSLEENAFNISKSLVTGSAHNAYVGAFDIIIPKGYYDGVSSSRIHIPNLLPQNIIEGSKIGWDGNYIDGSIPNRGESQYSSNIAQADGYIAMRKIPWGYYPENNNECAPEIRVNNNVLASAIGLTADKIIKGASFLEVIGTANNAYFINNIVTEDDPNPWEELVGSHIWTDIRIYTATGFNFTPSGAIMYRVDQSNYNYEITIFINDSDPRFVMLSSAHDVATEITFTNNSNYLYCTYGSITIPASYVPESYTDHYQCIIFN